MPVCIRPAYGRLALALPSGPVAAQTYDLVLMGGRVMDPESGMDAVMNVGILTGPGDIFASAPRSHERQAGDLGGGLRFTRIPKQATRTSTWMRRFR